jgi:hypothetical protein
MKLTEKSPSVFSDFTYNGHKYQLMPIPSDWKLRAEKALYPPEGGSIDAIPKIAMKAIETTMQATSCLLNLTGRLIVGSCSITWTAGKTAFLSAPARLTYNVSKAIFHYTTVGSLATLYSITRPLSKYICQHNKIKEYSVVLDPSPEIFHDTGYIGERESRDLSSSSENWRFLTKKYSTEFAKRAAIYANSIFLYQFVLDKHFTSEVNPIFQQIVQRCCTDNPKPSFCGVFKQYFKLSWKQKIKLFFAYHFVVSWASIFFIEKSIKNILFQVRTHLFSKNETKIILALRQMIKKSNSFFTTYLNYMKSYAKTDTFTGSAESFINEHIKDSTDQEGFPCPVDKIYDHFAEMLITDFTPKLDFQRILINTLTLSHWYPAGFIGKTIKIALKIVLYFPANFIGWILGLLFDRKYNKGVKDQLQKILQPTVPELIKTSIDYIKTSNNYKHVINEFILEELLKFQLSKKTPSIENPKNKLSQDPVIHGELRHLSKILLKISQLEPHKDRDSLKKLFKNSRPKEGLLEHITSFFSKVTRSTDAMKSLHDTIEENLPHLCVLGLDEITPDVLEKILSHIFRCANNIFTPEDIEDIPDRVNPKYIHYHNTAVELDETIKQVIDDIIEDEVNELLSSHKLAKDTVSLRKAIKEDLLEELKIEIPNIIKRNYIEGGMLLLHNPNIYEGLIIAMLHSIIEHRILIKNIFG